MAEDIDKRIDQLVTNKRRLSEIYDEARRRREAWEKKTINIKIPGLGMLVWMAGIGYPKQAAADESESAGKIATTWGEIVGLLKERPGTYPLKEIEGKLLGRGEGVLFLFSFDFKVSDEDVTVGFSDKSLVLQKGDVERPTLEIGSDQSKTIILPEGERILMGARMSRWGYWPDFDNMFAYWKPVLSDEPQRLTFDVKEDTVWTDSRTDARTYSDTKVLPK